MTRYAVKYPKTMHLPWSPGLQNDDRVMPTLEHLKGEEIVVTEKMDGENTSLYRDGLHARSIDGRYHPSRSWVMAHWAEKACLQIPPGSRVCGENMYAEHSIRYDDLETYFYAFGYWDHDYCFPWELSLRMFDRFGFKPVPEIWRGEYNEQTLRDIADDLDLDRQEGYVVRVTRGFNMAEFPFVVGKWVRRGHVQTDEHWMHREVVPNGLRDGH